MIGKWIHQMTGVLWPAALLRVGLWLALCLLIGALMPAAVGALGNHNVRPEPGTNLSTTPVAGPATYRYAAQPDGTTEVQRSSDGGLTWPAVGMIPEPVVQLAVNPANDAVVFARTGPDLWRSGNSGASWARIDSLPGRPLALAFAGSSDPSGILFAGTETQGLYSSLNSGTNWQAAGGPLSPVGAGSLAVTALAVNPGNQHVVYAAANFMMATPEGEHRLQSVYISVDDGRRWFAMAPAPGFDQIITHLIPVNGSLLAVWMVDPLAGAYKVALNVNSALKSGLDDANAGTRGATALALGLSHDRSLLPVLLQHLRDPDALAGDQVAEAIGGLGDPAAVPLLMPLLSDTDVVIRARAATALGLLQAKEAIPQLSTMLQHDGPWATRYAAEALANIGTPEAMAALVAPLHDAEMTPARFMAMRSLETAGQTAVTPLALALMDKDPVVRRNAAEALGYLRAADTLPFLSQALSDQDAAVRTQAHWALSEMQAVPAAQLALRQAGYREPGRPILWTAGMAARTTGAFSSAERQTEPPPWAALPGALDETMLNRWILGALASLLALAILAAMVIGSWKRPRQHLRPS